MVRRTKWYKINEDNFRNEEFKNIFGKEYEINVNNWINKKNIETQAYSVLCVILGFFYSVIMFFIGEDDILGVILFTILSVWTTYIVAKTYYRRMKVYRK